MANTIKTGTILKNGGMYGLEWSSGDRYCAGDHHARLLGRAAFDGLFGAAILAR